jgi:threonine dehydrogenase-like Zn-dependent dehydrogenase
MASLRVLISGGGIAGATLAHWLTGGGHRVTIVERADRPSSSGSVIGLLATRLATLNGATVIAVDGISARRDAAVRWGAAHALAPDENLAVAVRELTNGAGADTAIELSGNYHALQAALRPVGANGTHRFRIDDAAEAYQMLDSDPSAALQVVLEFS